MKKIVYKSKIIQAIILIIAACFLVSLWPLRIWQETVTSSVLPQTGTMTDAVNNDCTVLQSFVAQYDHMNTINLYLGEATEGESFFVRLLNEGQVMIAEEEVFIEPDNLPGYYKVLIDVDMEVGKMYHLIVQGNDSQVYLGCEFIPMTDMPYAGTMYYNNEPVEGMNLAADYNYGVPLRKGKVFLFGAACAVLAALLIGAVRLYYKKREDKLITVERAFKCVMNPIVAVLTVVCLIAVLMGACGNYVLDNTFFFISVLLLSMILFYGINHNRDGQKPVVTVEYIRSHFPDLLQSVFISGAISGCCEYVAGIYDIHHAMAERKEMLFFALAIIAMFKWKEIFNLSTLIYGAAAGVAGYFYYQNQVALLAEKTIKEAEIPWNLQVIRHTTWIGILLGFIVLRIVIGLVKKKLARPNFIYAGLLLLFFAAIIVFRNGRWWTVALAVSFTLFYLAYGMWEHKERLLTNVCRGIVLQFMLATGYALLHRPYSTYRTARYPHIFHTVTITAVYLTMVECAAIVLLLQKYRTSHKLKDTWKELVFLGVVTAYLLFTISRTGFFAVGAAAVFAIIIMSSGKGKQRLMNMGKSALGMILAIIVCFPVTFTVQRTVPALASDPYMYEIEDFRDATLRGRKLDSVEFMRVGRFIDLFAEKVFGIPAGTFDLYGEIAEYKRTHPNGEDAKVNPLPGQEEANFGERDDVLLVASADYVPDAALEEEDGDDYTNGRFEIFRSYFEQLNMTGHEEMGAVLANGELATHAHNIYLQVAFDHGIWVGILFLVVGAGTFAAACLYYYKKKDEIAYAALPGVVALAFAVAGMVEWIFHVSNPFGFVLMLVIAPLVFKTEN